MAIAIPSFTELLSTPSDKRDLDWEMNFLTQFPSSNVNLLFPDAKPGPDNWPYLFVQTANEGSEPVLQIISWLATRGIGLAVNPQKESPDFVFTYGMIWNFKERGVFISPAEERPQGSFEVKGGQKFWTGQPTEGYLPNYVRTVLKQFWLDQGVFAPKILLISEDQENFDLCFSIESIGSPKEEERMGVAEAISWFLPSHYTVALLNESAVPGFEPL